MILTDLSDRSQPASSWDVVGRVAEADARSRNVVSYNACMRSREGFMLSDMHFVGAARSTKPSINNAPMRVCVFNERSGAPLEVRDLSSRSAFRAAAFPVAFVPASTETWVYSERGGDYKIAILAFDANTLEHKLLDQVDHSLFLQPRFGFSNERIHALTRGLMHEITSPSELSGLSADSLLVLLLVELVRSLRGSEPKAASLRRSDLARVIEHIEENLDSQVRLADLAALTGLSVSYFCEAFRAATGLPPHRWQLQARIKKAQRLMLRRELPLASIALASGFADQSHFTRTFRRLERMTPTQWLRMQPPHLTIHDLDPSTTDRHKNVLGHIG